MRMSQTEGVTIPPALLAEIQAAADDEHRPAIDVVRDALERYLLERRINIQVASPRPDAAEAVARMLAFRKVALPEGMTLKEMIADGRA